MSHQSSRWRPPLPREHGAWAMFIAPLIVGIGAAGVMNVQVVLFGLAAFGFFLLRYPLMLALKSRAPEARRSAWMWSLSYGVVTLLTGALLLAMSQQLLLVPLAALGMALLAIYLWHAARRAEMTTVGEWTGIAGLALAAPGVYLVARGALDFDAVALYLLNVLFFGGTVFYIKFRVREQPRLAQSAASWRARLWAGRVTIIYHVLAVGLIAAFALLRFIPALVLLAFVLPLCKAIGGSLTRPARPNLPRLGFIELGVTTVFAVVILLAYS